MIESDFSEQLTEIHRISLELSRTASFDELCFKAIELGLSKLGFERLSFWYVDNDNPDYLKGSYGTDENGHIRDERNKRIKITSHDANALLLSGEIYIDYHSEVPLYNDDEEIVGYGDVAMVGLWDGNKYIGCMATDDFFSRTPISKNQKNLLLIYGRTLGNLSTIKLAAEEIKSHTRFEKILKEITRVSIEQINLGEMIYSLEDLLGKLFNGLLSRIYTGYESVSDLFVYKEWEKKLFRKYRDLKEKLILSDINGYGSILLLPLSLSEYQNGLIMIAYEKKHLFNSGEIDRGEQAVWQIALAIHKAQLFKETLRLSALDELTGINNRRNFFLLAEREVQRSIRQKSNLAIIMLDIDHFKKINDTYGHLSGDSVLKVVAETLFNALREVDIIGRYGGEEFVVLLPDTDKPNAVIVAERLIQSIRDMKNPLSDSAFKLSISGGISLSSEEKPELYVMLEEADRALYQAKDKGRDRFEFYSPN